MKRQGWSRRTWQLASWLLPALYVILGSPPGDGRAEGSRSSVTAWTFEQEEAGSVPAGFVVGTLYDGRQAGDWRVLESTTLPPFLAELTPRERNRVTKLLRSIVPPSAPQVLAQLKHKGFEHDYQVLLAQGTKAADLDLEVRFLPVTGKADMGGGLIWRAEDDRNYYLTRANPLEQNIRLYRIVEGVREKLANADRIISVDRWHRLRVIAEGDRFQVFYDDDPILTVRDSTFTRGGMIGLWTKADAVTYFDDLRLRIITRP